MQFAVIQGIGILGDAVSGQVRQTREGPEMSLDLGVGREDDRLGAIAGMAADKIGDPPEMLDELHLAKIFRVLETVRRPDAAGGAGARARDRAGLSRVLVIRLVDNLADSGGKGGVV